jgi:hypothetical protein
LTRGDQNVKERLIVYPEASMAVPNTPPRRYDFYSPDGVELGFLPGPKVPQLKVPQTTYVQ